MLNLNIFSITGVDSALLQNNASVIHQIKDAGEFWIAIYNAASQIEKRLVVQVDEQAKSFIINITADDLPTGKACCCTENGILVYTLRSGGFVHLKGSEDGCFAMLYKAGSEDAIWDSRKLDAGDFFAFMLLRPGKYSFSNRISGAECLLTVAYPDPRQNSKAEGKEAEPVRLRTEYDANWEPLTIKPGQGVVVEVNNPSRLYCDLREVDDGPEDLIAWKNELKRNNIL
ncbi:hypothetical protein [Foetidibacter luteolus]|uniref:hypothetical protein n=1 Tax=Foetidibacter luteolus TaxID=2608880 RepID=UPI00129AE667|nr:hypothetical protein [Foetidibacter luteolus]